jgi:large subunit ribosomal protein L17
MAMIRNLVKDLLVHGSVRTTEAKAKEVRAPAERIITLGKDGTLHARRQALRFLNDKDIVAQVFNEIAPRYADRSGGYTRITKLGNRVGDSAPMARLELLSADE